MADLNVTAIYVLVGTALSTIAEDQKVTGINVAGIYASFRTA